MSKSQSFLGNAKPFGTFITLILFWNFILPFIFWNGFTQGAFSYFDIFEILILGVTPFNVFLMTFILKNIKFSTKTKAFLTIFMINFVGILGVMFGYEILVNNMKLLTNFNSVPYSINFGVGALIWLAILISGIFSISNPSLKYVGKDSIQFNLPDQAAKTQALELKVSAPSPVQVPESPQKDENPVKAKESSVQQAVNPDPVQTGNGETKKPDVNSADPNFGKIFHGVEFVDNTGKNRVGLIAKDRIGGKIAFPDRRSVQQPKAGEIWTVQITGTNQFNTVYFVKCLNLESSNSHGNPQESSQSQAPGVSAVQNSPSSDPGQSISL